MSVAWPIVAIGERGFDRDAGGEDGVVVSGAMPDHQADRQLVVAMAGQAEGATVEEVDAARVAQQEIVGGEEGTVVVAPPLAPLIDDELPVGLMVWHGAGHDDAVLAAGIAIEAALAAHGDRPRD